MRVFSKIIISTFLLVNNLSFAQEIPDAPGIDTSYIQTFPKALTIKPYLDYKINQFRLDDDATKSKLNYFTYQAPTYGFGAAYKWMSFLVGLVPVYQLDKDEKGITTQMDIQWNIYLKSIATDLRYQRYDGYFLNNSNDIEGHNKAEEGHYKRPDLSTISLGMNLRYTFNSNKFSQKAVYSQTEKQLKSAGAFSVGARWNMLEIGADSNFVPSNINPEFIDFNINFMQIFDQGFGFGYSYSYIHKNWFANASIMPWFIFQLFNYRDSETGSLKMKPSGQFAIQTRGAIGYNGKKDYCGIVFVSDQMRSRWKQAHDIGYDFANVKLFYARRFNL